VQGEADLAILLRDLKPELAEAEYGYGLLPGGVELPAGLAVFARIEETEGVTLIAAASDLAAAGIPHQPGWARITLTVHSALSAVGLTAAVATALAEAEISANVIAGTHHDHLFIPWLRRHEALAILSVCPETKR
jgi:hypothetical protein